MSRLQDLGSQVAAHQDAQRRKVATGAWARERFVNAAVETRAGAGGRRVKVALLAGLAVAAGLIPLLYLARPGKPLTFTVAECSAESCAGGTVNAVGGQTLLRFSDGTRFDLEPATSARVLETNAHGARVAVDSGRARIAVPPGRGGQWSVEAGPYRVLITGTRLDVAWRAGDEQITVSLLEGQVRVSGGNLPAEVAVRAGQTLTASMRGDRWRMDTAAATEPAPSSAPAPPAAPAALETPPSAGSPARAPVAAAAAPRTSAAPPQAGPTRPARAATTPPLAPQWRQLAAAGDFRAAVQEADAEGFDLLCQRASARDLLALSEAARFAGQPARAKAALLSLRRRFSGRPEAAVAGFVLGRLAFDDEHDYRAAGRWFQGYLEANSAGPLSREAAGRLVEALVKAGDRAAARAAARAYLDRFPGGPHAPLAGQVIEAAP